MDSITKRIDNVTEINSAYLQKVCPPPPSIKVETSNKCNYKCTFCSLRTRDNPGKEEMPWEYLKHVMDITHKAGVKEHGCFFLGEATMEPALLVDEIRYAKQIGFDYVFLTTNGSLLTSALIHEMMSAGLDSMKFSINAKDNEQFEEVMGVKAKNNKKALTNLKQARWIRDHEGYKTKQAKPILPGPNNRVPCQERISIKYLSASRRAAVNRSVHWARGTTSSKWMSSTRSSTKKLPMQWDSTRVA